MIIETRNLQTIHNFAKNEDVTTSYIYQLIHKHRILEYIEIDGMKFIDKEKYGNVSQVVKEFRKQKKIKFKENV